MSTWEDLVARYRATWLERQWGFEFALEDCSSPIEKVFLAYAMSSLFDAVSPQRRDRWERAMAVIDAAGVGPNEVNGVDKAFYAVLACAEDERFLLSVQPTLVLDERRMRPDFTLITGPAFDGGCRVAIELDGHDFHERTPEQAERDKSKDRLLQKHGWIVLRFTGREVLRDPNKCLFEAMDHGRQRIRAQMTKDGKP